MSRKTKIIFLITKGNFGGAQRYVYDLATNLPSNEFEIVVAAGAGEILLDKLTRLCRHAIKIKNLGRDINPWADLKAFVEIWRLLRREKPDLIHLNSSKMGGLGALAGRLAGVPIIIFTVHGLASNEVRPVWQKLLINISHWLSFVLCHRIITVADYLKNQIETWPGLRDKVTTISNGLPAIKFFERSVSRRIIWSNQDGPVSNKKIWIGTIAELHPNKGLDFLIEAFAATVRALLGDSLGWSLQLVIIGEGEERSRLAQLIKAKRLEDRIFLPGRIEDARAYLKAFDIFALTSRTEALPYVILEAGAAGLPVVASEVGGLPEVIPEAEYGILVPPGNIEELKKSFLFLLKKLPYRRAAGANLRRRIHADFSLKQMVAQTIAVYRK